MNADGQALCLSMIVKNEASVIRRCIDSVRPIIDHWVIVDTGSTDGTQDIIRSYLRDLPGELHERPWRDFAHNRTEALELTRGKCDYALIIDADDTLDIARGAVLPPLTADSYMIEISDANIVYQRTQMVRRELPWRYQGVLHEFLTCEGAGAAGQLPGIRMRRNHDGARRKDPQTYRRDAAVLETALRTEADPFLLARYRFYLAQSYRDCGELSKSLEHYQARSGMGFWQEEVFVSLYSAAQLKEQLRHPEQEVIEAYLRAADALPTRAEALYAASRYCRQKKRYREGYRIAERGLAIPMPSSQALFLEPWGYEVGLLDEASLNAYWSGRYRESLDASLKLLASGKLPAGETQRVVANARFAAGKLPRQPDLAVPEQTFAEQHALAPPRSLHSRVPDAARILVAILASQNEMELPLHLACIEALDYPKSSIVLYIHACNSIDGTEHLLRNWIERVGHLYANVEFDAGDAKGSREQSDGGVPAEIRMKSLIRASESACDYLFMADVGNFVRRSTLRELAALNLPIVAPFLRALEADDPFANFHAATDGKGYYKNCSQYEWAINRWMRGVIEMPVVNGTYLVRADVLGELAYEDGTRRHHYVIFSEIARQRGILQYLDNRQVYGYVARRDGVAQSASAIRQAERLLANEAEQDGLDVEIPTPSWLANHSFSGARAGVSVPANTIASGSNREVGG